MKENKNTNAASKTERQIDRKCAFELVFQIPFYQEPGIDGLTEENKDSFSAEKLKDYFECFGEKATNKVFISKTFAGVLNNLAAIDRLISSGTEKWDLQRLNSADLAVLRLALYEIKFSGSVPRGAAVHEAVELSKEYGTDDSPAFVNAVLGKIAGYGESKPL